MADRLVEKQELIPPNSVCPSDCTGVQGYREVWLNNNTLLTCQSSGQSAIPSWVIPVSVVLSVAALLMLVAMLLFIWLRMTVQLRPRWQREKELIENRKKGMPSGGPATIVVTDIECYSGEQH